FGADRSRSGELEQARQVVVAGRELVQKLDPLRGSSDQPFDGVRLRFDNVEKDIAFEWNRREVLAELRPLLERPTDASVEAAKEKLAANGLTNDAEASKLGQDASAMPGRQGRYEPAPAPPLRTPAGSAAAVRCGLRGITPGRSRSSPRSARRFRWRAADWRTTTSRACFWG